MKEMEAELEMLSITEDHLKGEMRHLASEYIYAQEEIKRIQAVYLSTGNFVEMLDEDYGIIGSSQSQYYVRVLSTLNREDLKPNA
jgi:26S proteasome regulatory subunit T3